MSGPDETGDAEAIRALMLEVVGTWRDPHSGDRHVMPLYGREHESDARCWCLPKCTFRAGTWPYDRRVWLHAEDN